MKVEQALGLLPDLEVLAPLRTLLLASARADERAVWGSSGPYLTVGKRDVAPVELRRRLGQAVRLVTDHVARLFACYTDALDHQERGDAAAVVGALLEAGRLEAGIGRLEQAHAWFDVALGSAVALPDRKPEVEALLELGKLGLVLGRFEESARHFQRGLALAEAEFDQAGAIEGSLGLGAVARERGEWAGAAAWYGRALRLAEAASDDARRGRVLHALGELARRQGDLTGAGEHLRRAREAMEAGGGSDAGDRASLLNTQGRVDAELGRAAAATAAYREALAWARRGERDAGLEVAIRLNLARQHTATAALIEAEQEIRRAEQIAIAAGLTRKLALIYAQLGALRGRQGDETGFVFFEQALELARSLQRSPLVEAQVLHEYGVFKQGIGQADEARAYLEEARALFESVGGNAELEVVKADLERLSA